MNGKCNSREAICRLKARYFRLVDTKDWAGLAQLFTRDARFDRGFGHAVRNPVTGRWSTPAAPEPEIVAGRDAIVAMIRSSVDDLWTVHQGFMPEIDLTAPDRASAIWAMSDELRTPDGILIVAGRGHYHDEYRREQDVWRISFSRLTRLHLQQMGQTQ